MKNILLISDIGNGIDDIFTLIYLKSIEPLINITGIIASGNSSRLRRLIMRAYLKIFDFKNWRNIPIYYTIQETKNETHKIDIYIKDQLIELLIQDYIEIENLNQNESITYKELEKKYGYLQKDPDYDNEYGFINDVCKMGNVDILCIGPLIPLNNAVLISDSILKYFKNIFIEASILNVENNKEINILEKSFCEYTDYHNESKIEMKISPDINSYNICGIYNEQKRNELNKNYDEINIITSSIHLLKKLNNNSNINLYFVGKNAANMIGITENDIKDIEYKFIVDYLKEYLKQTNNKIYYPTEVMCVIYLHTLIDSNIRTEFNFCFLEKYYYKIKSIGINSIKPLLGNTKLFNVIQKNKLKYEKDLNI
jgi:hypothetical protein